MGKAKYPSNPKTLGALWFSIHILARHADTPERKSQFIDYMYLLSVEFPCGKCRSHIQEYLKNHPFDPFMNMVNEKGEDVGMFKWSWMFHNTVNLRLHKPFVDWDTAWEMFDTGREVCTNCSGSLPNSRNNSYEEVISKKKPNMVDKKKIVQGYFLRNNH